MRSNIKPIIYIFIALSLISLLFVNDTSIDTSIRVFFSPNGGCTKAIVYEIMKAKTVILVQAYSFTSKEIANALAQAKNTGIDVEIILDKSNESLKYSAADFAAHMGIPTYIDPAHNIAHNKVMIIDNETVITGSFNFSKAAEEHNAENLLIFKSREIAKKYINNWNIHLSHSYKYTAR